MHLKIPFVIPALLVSLASSAFAAPVQLFANPGFESGLEGWKLWPAGTTTTMAVDDKVAHSGTRSLRLDASRTEARGYANTSAGGIRPNTVYRVSVFVRVGPGLAESDVRWRINYRNEAGRYLTGARPMKIEKMTEGDWTRWTGLFPVDEEVTRWQFVIGIDGGIGTLWVDDIRVEDLGPPSTEPPDVWHYNPLGVQTGPEPYRRFVKHKDQQDIAYRMAKRYNLLLNETAAAERLVLDARRMSHYRNRPVDPRVPEAFEAMENSLNEAWSAFGKAFTSGAEQAWQEFADAADVLEGRIGGLRRTCASAIQALGGTSPSGLPDNLGPVPRNVPAANGDGTLNRLFFGAWSPPVFAEFEQPFDLEFHSSAPGRPRVHTPEKIDFSNITRACDNIEKLGYTGTFGYLHFGSHGQMYAPEWFVKRHAEDKDFMLLSWDGKTANRTGRHNYPLNWFHPAVRNYIRDYCGKYAAFCAKDPRILFYEICQETTMQFSAGGALRSPGYGPHARRAFQAYLAKKYGTIEVLNTAWGAEYAGFDAIEQPPDRLAQPRKEATPLTAEYEAFNENAFLDYFKLVHDSLKKADPDTPVTTRHSLLLRRINPARIFETCDIVGVHSAPPVMRLLSIMFNSMLRYRTGSAGWMEHGWASQEEGNRFEEEIVQRRAMFKNIARACVWGRTTQMVWYGYTNARYLTRYNANWFNPRYDVLTLRYSAAALGVVVRRLRRLDWVLTHSRVAPSQICLIQPSTAMRNQRTYGLSYREMLAFHEMLYPAGILYEALPEEFFLDGSADLSSFKIVLLPCATHLPHRLQEMLVRFVKAGGAIIATQPPGVYDELARPSCLLMRELLQVDSATPHPREMDRWTFAAAGAEVSADSALVSASSGKGRTIVSFAPLSRLAAKDPARRKFRQFIENITTPLAYAENRRFDVTPRITEDGRLYVFVINTNVDEALEDTIVVKRKADSVVDVSLPEPCEAPCKVTQETTAVSLRLDPGDMAALLIR